MRTEIIRDYKRFLELEPAWQDLLGRSQFHTVFQTFEWANSWWQSWGKGHSLMVIALWEGEVLVALAPLMICHKPFGANQLQFIGHELSDYLDFIIAGDSAVCFEALSREVMRKKSLWHSAELIFVRADSPNFDQWRRFIDHQCGTIKSFKVNCVSVVADIAERGPNWEEFEKSLPAKRRNDLKRTIKLLRQQGDLKFEILTEYSEIKTVWLQFVQVHRKRWHERGRVSVFDRPEVIEHYLNIARQLTKHRWLELSCLKLDQKVIALAFCYVYQGRYYYYTPTFDPDYYKFSPGNMLIRFLIESCYQRGIGIFDLLRGDETYKYVWSRTELPLYQSKIFRYTPLGVAMFFQEKAFQYLLPYLKKVPFLRWIKQKLKSIQTMHRSFSLRQMILWLLSREQFLRFYCWIRKPRAQIILYHTVSPDEADQVFSAVMPLKKFEQQMEYLKNNFEIVPLSKFDPSPGKLAISFDDGYAGCYHYAFPILKQNAWTAMFFVNPGLIDVQERGEKALLWWDIIEYLLVDEHLPRFVSIYANHGFRVEKALEIIEIMKSSTPNVVRAILASIMKEFCREIRAMSAQELLSWEQAREMIGSGMEFGCHTLSHITIIQVGPTELEQEVLGSRKILEEKLNANIRFFAVPYGGSKYYSSENLCMIRQWGYEKAVVTLDVASLENQDNFCLNRVTINQKDDLDLFKLKVSGLFEDILRAKQMWGKLWKSKIN